MSASSIDRRALAWKICLSGMLALSVAMGIGRFAFTPLLPLMLHEGSIDLRMGGWLATANYIGYFIGAMLCAFARSGNPVPLIRAGLIATIVLTLGMAWHGGDALWLLLRLLSGIASAYVFVYTANWCLQQLTHLCHPALGGVIFCGPGVGITLSGLLTGAMVSASWSAAAGWAVFGLISALFATLIWRTFDMRLPESENHAAAASVQHGNAAPVDPGEVRQQIIAYGLAGFGYIITATFLPVIARQALPGSSWPDFFWPIFGAGVALGAVAATRLPVHGDQRLLLAVSYVMQALGIIVCIVWPTAPGFALSCLLLGLPFTAITLFAMREARRLRQAQASQLIAVMTAAYGIGQIAGPPLATALVHQSGSFTPSLLVAVVALLAGAALYYRLTQVHRLAPHTA